MADVTNGERLTDAGQRMAENVLNGRPTWMPNTGENAMDLTDWNKQKIDAMSYDALLAHWRGASIGDPWFQGETGEYWQKRMAYLRSQPGGDTKHVLASKAIGWDAK